VVRVLTHGRCTHRHAIASTTVVEVPSLTRLLRRRPTADIRGVPRITGETPVLPESARCVPHEWSVRRDGFAGFQADAEKAHGRLSPRQRSTRIGLRPNHAGFGAYSRRPGFCGARKPSGSSEYLRTRRGAEEAERIAPRHSVGPTAGAALSSSYPKRHPSSNGAKTLDIFSFGQTG
jgi:hypothetical protein